MKKKIISYLSVCFAYLLVACGTSESTITNDTATKETVEETVDHEVEIFEKETEESAVMEGEVKEETETVEENGEASNMIAKEEITEEAKSSEKESAENTETTMNSEENAPVVTENTESVENTEITSSSESSEVVNENHTTETTNTTVDTTINLLPDSYASIMNRETADFVNYFKALDPTCFAEVETAYPRIELAFDDTEVDDLVQGVYAEFYKPDGTVDFIIRVCEYKDNENAYLYYYNYRHYTNVYDKSLARQNTDGESWYIGSSVLDYRHTAMEAAFLNNNRVIYYFIPNGSTKTVDEIKTDFYYVFKMPCAYNG